MPWYAPGSHPAVAVAVCPSGLIHCLDSLVAYGYHLCTHSDGAVKHLIYSPFLHQICSQGLFGVVLSALSKHTQSRREWIQRWL